MALAVYTSCEDKVGDNIYTKKLDLIGEYMEHHPDHYSGFYALLEKTEMLGLMNSYGAYTCFIPNNEAVDEYFKNSEFGSMENYPVDSLKKIVLYQIIENDTISTSEFTGDRLRTTNMMGDFLQVKQVGADIIINNLAKILLRDQIVKNGIIHETDAFLFPDKDNVVGKLDNEGANSRYSIFSEALKETGISALLDRSLDPREFSYTKTENEVPVKVIIPKLYRYTLLVESDELYRKKGINNYEDLKKRYAGADNNVTNPKNGLYRFIAYHCLDRQYTYTQFGKFAEQDGYEIVETMCENTLLEFRNYPEGIVFNRFTDDEGQVIYPGSKVTSNYDHRNIMANNGMLHEIDSLLEIPDQNKYFHKKMRFNVASFLPELMNNGYRGYESLELPNAMLKGPQYFDNLTITGEAGYVIPKYDYTSQWIRHQYDEILIGAGYSPWEQETTGKLWGGTRYDVKLVLPPFPEGTWEVRFGYTSNQYRGMAQIFMDNEPAGVPLWMGPVTTAYYGIDGMDEETARKVLYNNSYMPYPSHITNGSGSAALYTSVDRLRRIIGTYSWDEMKKHVLRFKSVEAGQLSLNFIELIPVELISEEGTD
ncbi:hypothetical protein FACS189413_07910 [Bacteroidia bacterium]|nr:hypothetical protein FACS189413_07910 [Bacteroidia bacterium]